MMVFRMDYGYVCPYQGCSTYSHQIQGHVEETEGSPKCEENADIGLLNSESEREEVKENFQNSNTQ